MSGAPPTPEGDGGRIGRSETSPPRRVAVLSWCPVRPRTCGVLLSRKGLPSLGRARTVWESEPRANPGDEELPGSRGHYQRGFRPTGRCRSGDRRSLAAPPPLATEDAPDDRETPSPGRLFRPRCPDAVTARRAADALRGRRPLAPLRGTRPANDPAERRALRWRSGRFSAPPARTRRATAWGAGSGHLSGPSVRAPR